MTSSKVQKIEKFVLETLVVLTRFLAQKQGDRNKMVATLMKDNRFSFPKIYRKSQISLFFFEKIAIEVDRFLQQIVTKTTKLMKLNLKLWGCL